MAETITVTVSVDMADVIDVLAWHESADYGWEYHQFKPTNDRWLAAYQDLDGDEREELWRSMPASLQWCLHELDQRGVTPLWWALSAAGVPDPRLADQVPTPTQEDEARALLPQREPSDLWNSLDWMLWGVGMGDTFREPLADKMIAAISDEEFAQAEALIRDWNERRGGPAERNLFAELRAELAEAKAEPLTIDREALSTDADPGSHGGPIPSYGMLDVWMALFGTSHPGFDKFYDEHGYAEAWARLLHEVRTRPALSAQEAATEVETVAAIPTDLAGNPFELVTMVEIDGQVMTVAQFDAARFPLLNPTQSEIGVAAEIPFFAGTKDALDALTIRPKVPND